MLDVTFADATEDDREAISALHIGSARQLLRDFGDGPWARSHILRRVDSVAPRSCVRLGRRAGAIVSALRLQRKKPWAIDVSYSSPVSLPLYLVGMVVAPAVQRTGVGRAAMADALEVARAWGAGAIRLDAWAGPAGAGAFYERCGYAERGYVTYRGTALVYYERVIDAPTS